MSSSISRLFKDPMSDVQLGRAGCVAAIASAAVVDAWFQSASFRSLSSWVLQTVLGHSAEEAATTVADVVARQATPLWLKLVYGLLMVAFAMIFMVPTARLEARRADDKSAAIRPFSRVCSWLVFPTALMLVASLVIDASLALGLALAIAAALCCVAHMVRSCQRAHLNGYVTLILVTLCFTLTAVLLVRNHVVTLSGLL